MTRWMVVALACAGAIGCVSRSNALADLIEARRLAADVHVAFIKAADASNRAVMSDTDKGSSDGADEAMIARAAIRRDVQALRPLLLAGRFTGEAATLDAFASRFSEYERLDDDILPLAVENTNLKAQRLSFTRGRDAVAAFRAALPHPSRPSAAAAEVAILEIVALQAPHIAEASDDAMTRIESDMAAAEKRVRAALSELKPSLPTIRFEAATRAFNEFMSINAEIVRLSRRNSNVRSLALALGKKHTVTAECEAQLHALEQALAQHDFRATR